MKQLEKFFEEVLNPERPFRKCKDRSNPRQTWHRPLRHDFGSAGMMQNNFGQPMRRD